MTSRRRRKKKKSFLLALFSLENMFNQASISKSHWKHTHTKEIRSSLLSSLSLLTLPFAQLFIKINFPNGYSNADSLSSFLSFSSSFSQSSSSFCRLLLWAHDTRQIELDSPLSIVIGYFSITHPAHSFFLVVLDRKHTHTQLYSLFSCFTVN